MMKYFIKFRYPYSNRLRFHFDNIVDGTEVIVQARDPQDIYEFLATIENFVQKARQQAEVQFGDAGRV